MPRDALREVPISPGGALLWRPSSPAPRPWPQLDEENMDAVLHRVDSDAGRILGRMQRITAQLNYSRLWLQPRSNVERQRQSQQRSGSLVSQAVASPLDPSEGEDGNGEDANMDSDEDIQGLEADDSNNTATRGTTTPQLSMGMETDASDSELDLSVLAMARGAGRGGVGVTSMLNNLEEQIMFQQQTEAPAYGDELMLPDNYEAETSIEEPVEEDEEEQDEEEAEVLVDPASIGLKEISNLGKFTVSSHKPGNGVQELRSDDLKLYWQSDGPQPHKLTIYFIKRVGIRAIRFFVDYQEDESYTPTKIIFKSGTSENNMIEFATMLLENPFGWQDVPISGAGGDPDGNTLVSYVLQMQILENHQNGKDTHLRGIKIYAFDPDSGQQAGRSGGLQPQQQTPEEIAEEVVEMVVNSRLGQEAMAGGGSGGERLSDMARILASSRVHAGEGAFLTADFLREPELR